MIFNYWAFLIWLVSFILDSNYQILEKIFVDPFWVNIIRGLGGVALAYFTGSKLKNTFNKSVDRGNVFDKVRASSYREPETDESDSGIGGGGIKNPKDPKNGG